MSAQTQSPSAWPELPYAAWSDTCTTLHLWTQIVGKVQLAKSPWINHSWHVTLYVTARGLTTSSIPDGERQFQIDFDFIDHHLLLVAVNDGQTRILPLSPMPVADFYEKLIEILADLGISVRIHKLPNEVPDPITREAYSQEVSSAGFWPGGGPIEHAAFYSYAYPVPAGFGDCQIEPAEAYFYQSLGEFLLPYDAVRTSADPEATLLGFLQSTYEAAADSVG